MLSEDDLGIAGSPEYVFSTPWTFDQPEMGLGMSSEEGVHPAQNSTLPEGDADASMDPIETDSAVGWTYGKTLGQHACDEGVAFMSGSLAVETASVDGFDDAPGQSMEITNEEEPWNPFNLHDSHADTPVGIFSGHPLSEELDTSYSFTPPPATHQHTALLCHTPNHRPMNDNLFPRQGRSKPEYVVATPRGGQPHNGEDNNKVKKRGRARRQYRGDGEPYPYPPRSNNRPPGPEPGTGEASMGVSTVEEGFGFEGK